MTKTPHGYYGVIIPKYNFYQGYFLYEDSSASIRLESLRRVIPNSVQKGGQPVPGVSDELQGVIGALCGTLVEGARTQNSTLLQRIAAAIAIVTDRKYFVVRGEIDPNGITTSFWRMPPEIDSPDAARDYIHSLREVKIIQGALMKEAVELARGGEEEAMKIISKFTDYYDQVAHTYGKDPSIRYERLEIKTTGPFEYREIEKPMTIIYNRDLRNKYGERTLVVGERIYTIFAPEGSYLLGRPTYFLPSAIHEIITKDRKHSRDWKEKGADMLYVRSPQAIELCKLVGQPVFWMTQYYKAPQLPARHQRQKHLIKIHYDLPRLHKIRNFARFYPADQIYQDLSYVIGNLMHEPPDDNPPVRVSEAVRLEKKGFDRKTSFRGKT